MMIKTLFVSAALLSAPASAKAMEPVDAVATLIKFEVARQYCGFVVPYNVRLEYVKVVQPLLRVSEISFVQSVREAGYAQGAFYLQNGSLPGFCASVGRIYGRYGK